MPRMQRPEQGYVEVYSTAMVKRDGLVGTGGNLRVRENLYRDVEEDFPVRTTARGAVTTSIATRSSTGARLRAHVGFTACFRRAEE